MREVFIRISLGGKFIKGNSTRGIRHKDCCRSKGDRTIRKRVELGLLGCGEVQARNEGCSEAKEQ
jgi:hypothetical protein